MLTRNCFTLRKFADWLIADYSLQIYVSEIKENSEKIWRSEDVCLTLQRKIL